MRVRTKKPRGAVVTRRVLELTLEELGRVGLARLSLPRVAELAGIHKTSLYRRWPTKEALVTAALGLAVPAEHELPDRGTLEGDLVELAHLLSSFVQSSAGLGLLRMVFADPEPAATRRLSRSFWPRRAELAPHVVLSRAITRGELRADADPDLLLHTLAGAVLHRVFVEGKLADRRWARRVVRLLTQGVAPRGAARSPRATSPRRPRPSAASR
ncbi:MAG: TetR/AcrR family transcriptional regulator [Polyangiaceae bacterium]